MAQRYADRIAESTTTTGTGAITLGGALTGFKPFSSICSVGDTVFYSIWSVDGSGNPSGPWETGLGTYSATSTLTRTTPISGSATPPVSLTGTSYVTLSVIASQTPQIGPDNGITLPSVGTGVASTPSANNIQFFGRAIAGRQMLASVGPSGLDYAFQPILARNKIGYWDPPGNATTLPGVFGITAITKQASATVTTRNVATTNLATRMRRIGYPYTGSASGAIAGAYINVEQFSCGSGTPNDGTGFFFVERWVESDPAAVTAKRAFTGFRNTTSGDTNVEPDTLTNSIGVMELSTDSTQWYWYAGGTTANYVNTGIGTAIGAPGGNSTTAWELAIFSPSSLANTYYLQLTNLSTGVSATQTISGTSAQVPNHTLLLCWHHYITNNTSAIATGVDFCSLYVETDY